MSKSDARKPALRCIIPGLAVKVVPPLASFMRSDTASCDAADLSTKMFPSQILQELVFLAVPCIFVEFQPLKHKILTRALNVRSSPRKQPDSCRMKQSNKASPSVRQPPPCLPAICFLGPGSGHPAANLVCSTLPPLPVGSQTSTAGCAISTWKDESRFRALGTRECSLQRSLTSLNSHFKPLGCQFMKPAVCLSLRRNIQSVRAFRSSAAVAADDCTVP